MGSTIKGNPLTYPTSRQPYDHKIFQSPPSEYRGTPFWSWNSKLVEDEVVRQIDDFEEMGYGGFIMHSRTGLDTPYMGEEFMNIIRAASQRAKEKGMMATLYDEDRWPSGASGGVVVKKNPEYRCLHLLFTPVKYRPPEEVDPTAFLGSGSAVASRSELGHLLAKYTIELDQDGHLVSSQRLDPDDETEGENIWFAYAEPNPPSQWFNGETYVDTLSKTAIRSFIDTAYEPYAKKVGNYFGNAIPAVFTDEPQFAHKTCLTRAKGKEDIFMPWSEDLLDTFKAEYSYDLKDKIPELVWDLPVGSSPSLARYHYNDHCCERFTSAFMDQIGDWCRDHGILLTGHMMEEPTLRSQTRALGEAMRCYRNMGLPGIDLLCDGHEYNTAKQTASVARQNGLKGVMSELYGVTGWTFTFEGHKGCGDWQAALGVTYRVHHLAHYSILGEAKRDYPASLSYQSSWHREYKHMEDHFARVNVALTRGTPVTRVAVIHPIESFWLAYGPSDTSSAERLWRDAAFDHLTRWLLFGLVDFDFISESLLPSQTPLDKIGKQLPVGQCAYDAVIVPNLSTIRFSTLERLQKFAAAGGRVILAGETPIYVDAESPKSAPTISGSKTIQWSQYHVLNALEEFRDLKILTKAGENADSLMYQMRADGDDRYIFICNIDRKTPRDCDVSVKGSYVVNVLDTISGEEWVVKSATSNGWTTFSYAFEGCGSLLARLEPPKASTSAAKAQEVLRDSYKTVANVDLLRTELSEPNVLLLDFAEFRIKEDDSTPWEDVVEVLRIDNIVRNRLGIPLKKKAVRQPWSLSAEDRKPRATLQLRFKFNSAIDLNTCQIALERATQVGITLNGENVPSNVDGWWVDRGIKTVHLGGIKTGTNTLVLEYAYSVLTNLERAYILGDFDVSLRGTVTKLQAPSRDSLVFGDYTKQGLPFYAGDVHYHCGFSVKDDGKGKTVPTVLHLPTFSAPVVRVELDSKLIGLVATEPHMIHLGVLTPGYHTLKLTSYGNRHNAFGPIHLVSGKTDYIGPDAWRTEFEWWTDEYNLCTMGITQAPRFKKPGKEVLTVPRQQHVPFPSPFPPPFQDCN